MVVPPVTANAIAPVELPKHFTFVTVGVAANAAAGCVIVVVETVVHPLLSVIVTV